MGNINLQLQTISRAPEIRPRLVARIKPILKKITHKKSDPIKSSQQIDLVWPIGLNPFLLVVVACNEEIDWPIFSLNIFRLVRNDEFSAELVSASSFSQVRSVYIDKKKVSKRSE